MKRYSYLITIGILCCILSASCSKDADGTGDDGSGAGKYPADLKGTIYYDWATEGILQISLPDGTGGAFLPSDSKRNNVDISRDGKLKLTAVNASTIGNYKVKFTLSNMADGSVVEQFDYTSPEGNSYCHGYLSPDNSLIMITSKDYNDGITILKRNGEFVTRLLDIEGERLDVFNLSSLWLPGNALLITHNKYIIRLPPPYTSGKVIKEMNYEEWGKLAVNQAGNQVALQIGNHIHTMNIDGSDLKQVTTSNFTESNPVFSPDGKYLLVGTYYRSTGTLGHVWDMRIIPNDGQRYVVNPSESNAPGVIPVIWKDKDRIESGGGQMLWR